MNSYYNEQLLIQLNKKLRLYLLGSAAVILTGVLLPLAAVLLFSLTLVVAVALGLFTAALFLFLFFLWEHRIHPLRRTKALVAQLATGRTSTFDGIFRGWAQGKTIYAGVMMYRVLLDEGTRVGKETVYREVYLPAIFGQPEIKPGTALKGESVEGILVSSSLPSAQAVIPSQGRYQRPSWAALACLAAAALLWAGIFTVTQKPSAQAAMNVAVCTPAHHTQTQDSLEEKMAIEGVELVFSYTNTIEPETVAMYLATFGSMDADLLVLNGDHFAGIFENEAHPLDPQAITQALGFTPRFAMNGAQQPTGVVLYIPDDPEYNANFSKLFDWIAVEKEVPLVAAIRYNSVHAPTGAADLALMQLLCALHN